MCISLCLGILFFSLDICVSFSARTILILLSWLCSIAWSWELWYHQHWLFTQNCFISGLLCLHINFRIDFCVLSGKRR
jgi:hypothetical protein